MIFKQIFKSLYHCFFWNVHNIWKSADLRCFIPDQSHLVTRDFSCLSHGAKTRALGMEGSPSHWTFWHSLEQRQKNLLAANCRKAQLGRYLGSSFLAERWVPCQRSRRGKGLARTLDMRIWNFIQIYLVSHWPDWQLDSVPRKSSVTCWSSSSQTGERIFLEEKFDPRIQDLF